MAFMQLTIGQIVEGKITGITNFGVFADLGEGKTGMVHISEVARTYVNDIKEFVKTGDVVKMKVLNIGEDGKVSLSIKRALEPERTNEPRERRERRSSATPKIDGSEPEMKSGPTLTVGPLSYIEVLTLFRK